MILLTVLRTTTIITIILIAILINAYIYICIYYTDIGTYTYVDLHISVIYIYRDTHKVAHTHI